MSWCCWYIKINWWLYTNNASADANSIYSPTINVIGPYVRLANTSHTPMATCTILELWIRKPFLCEKAVHHQRTVSLTTLNASNLEHYKGVAHAHSIHTFWILGRIGWRWFFARSCERSNHFILSTSRCCFCCRLQNICFFFLVF